MLIHLLPTDEMDKSLNLGLTGGILVATNAESFAPLLWLGGTIIPELIGTMRSRLHSTLDGSQPGTRMRQGD